MNVNNFTNEFLGGARSDLFEVWIKYPDKLKEYMGENLAQFTAVSALQAFDAGGTVSSSVATMLQSAVLPSGSRLYVKKAKIPKFSVKSADVQYKGRTFPYATTREDEHELQLGLYNDVHFIHHSILSVWLEFIRTTQTNIGLYPKDYFGEIKVFQHDSLGNVLKVINFTNVFPKSVSEIALDWNDEKIEEFTGTFGYHLQLTDTSDEIKIF